MARGSAVACNLERTVSVRPVRTRVSSSSSYSHPLIGRPLGPEKGEVVRSHPGRVAGKSAPSVLWSAGVGRISNTYSHWTWAIYESSIPGCELDPWRRRRW